MLARREVGDGLQPELQRDNVRVGMEGVTTTHMPEVTMRAA